MEVHDVSLLAYIYILVAIINFGNAPNELHITRIINRVSCCCVLLWSVVPFPSELPHWRWDHSTFCSVKVKKTRKYMCMRKGFRESIGNISIPNTTKQIQKNPYAYTHSAKLRIIKTICTPRHIHTRHILTIYETRFVPSMCTGKTSKLFFHNVLLVPASITAL